MEEDSHYCLKCGSTLVGLDNYVNHRKTSCDALPSTKIYDTMALEEVDQKDEKAIDKVEADDFFSSLELQSSSKTTNPPININVSNKLSAGIVTRSKSLLSNYQEISKIPEKIEAKARTPKPKKTKKKRLLRSRKPRKILDTQKKQKEKKESGALQKRPVLEEVNEIENTREDDEWALFTHLVGRKDIDETKRTSESSGIRRYTPELFSMSPILITDELSEEKEAEVNKFLEDEDYDDDAYLNLEDVDEFNYAPPRSHTGGKWKPGSLPLRTSPMLWPIQTWDSLLEERQQEDEGRQEEPVESPTDLNDRSRNTFGKWKPCHPPATYTGGKWKPEAQKSSHDTPPVTHTGGKWHPGKRIHSEPPATYTGGKWKPQVIPNQSKSWKSDVEASSVGSWMQSKGSVDNKNVVASCQSTSGKCLKTAGGFIQYYCAPCNRRLASKKLYKKHVLSELHLKRVLQENDLEFDSRLLLRGLFSAMNTKQRGLGKRTIRKPEFFKDMDMSLGKRKDTKPAKRKRRELVRCDVCKAKLPSHQLGKHLVSYYHSRRIRLDDPNQQKLVLDNIHSIIKQAPYQCGICKFYFNTHSLFKKHWVSEEHRRIESTGKRFWCVLCNFECETSRSMELHLDSNSHREVIMAVNKSIPIIIRQKTLLNCEFCARVFRYNFALIRHNQISHGVRKPDSLHPCIHCGFKSKTVKSLQRHVLRSHKGTAEVPYFCSVCDLYFRSAEDAKNHRKSQSHRVRYSKTISAILSRPCPHCSIVLEDLDKLKAHITQQHPDLRPKCPKCGERFALPQEVISHKKMCEFRFHNVEVEEFRCRQCAYSSASKGEILYHEALHQKPFTDKDGTRKLYCPVCGKGYRAVALKIHLRSHTGERPFECRHCSKTFIRKSRLTAHLKSEHSQGDGALVQEPDFAKKKPEKSFEGPKCGDATCKYSAKDAEDMEYHSQVHIGRKMFQCPYCQYQAKTSTLLKRHNKIHLDERSYPCPHCPFRGRLASHLKRHLRVHTGAKPYKCPHCPYQCNILENLRKHVLFTKIHPGKKLYECKLCEYSTNAAKEFKQHLLEKHSDKFRNEGAITAYIAGIYSMEEDVQTAENPIPAKQKTIKSPVKMDRPTVLTNISILTKKFEPIAPKPSSLENRKLSESLKIQGNTVQDKRKVLEMELEKLKNQVKKKASPPLRSYPAPAILKAERDLKLKAKSAARKELPDDIRQTAPMVGSSLETEDPSPTCILFESGITFESNGDHLGEQEFYLLEDYND